MFLFLLLYWYFCSHSDSDLAECSCIVWTEQLVHTKSDKTLKNIKPSFTRENTISCVKSFDKLFNFSKLYFLCLSFEWLKNNHEYFYYIYKRYCSFQSLQPVINSYSSFLHIKPLNLAVLYFQLIQSNYQVTRLLRRLNHLTSSIFCIFFHNLHNLIYLLSTLAYLSYIVISLNLQLQNLHGQFLIACNTNCSDLHILILFHFQLLPLRGLVTV